MARKKNMVNPAEVAPLPLAVNAEPKPEPPKGGTPSQVPSFIEYEVGGVKWRCGRFDSLVADLGDPAVTAVTMTALHEMICRLERSWKILRRLFGIMPVLPASDYPMEEMRSWGRDELCEDFGITRKQLREELDGIRGLWAACAAASGLRGPDARAVTSQRAVTHPENLGLDEDNKLLERYALPMKFANNGLRDWFVGRVRDLEKLLQEKTTAGLAFSMLTTELQIRRLDLELNDPERTSAMGKEYRLDVQLKNDLDKAYQNQLEEMRKLAPWFSSVAGKHSFAGTLSDVTRAMQAYYAQGDTALADGIYTLTEIAVECRRSVQAPEPRYRASLVVYANMAKAFLFDPQWETRLPRKADGELHSSVRRLFKALDAAWRGAFIREQTEEGTPLPDLENGGEFEDLVPMPETPGVSRVAVMKSFQTKHTTPV